MNKEQAKMMLDHAFDMIATYPALSQWFEGKAIGRADMALRCDLITVAEYSAYTKCCIEHGHRVRGEKVTT